MLAICLLAGANIPQEVIEKAASQIREKTLTLSSKVNNPANKSVSVENWMYGLQWMYR